MRWFLPLLALLAAPALAADSGGKFIHARLIAQTLQPAPGSVVLIGIVMEPRPGWHSYWSNPGDSGIAPTVTWTAPVGVTFGPLHHPAPSIMRVGDDVSFVHAGNHVLLVPMTVSAVVARGTPMPITARLTWGSCTKSACVPERAILSLRLVAGSGKPAPGIRLLAAAKARLPKDAGRSIYELRKRAVTLRIPRSLGLDPSSTRYFPAGGDYYDAASARTGISGKFVVITARTRSAPPRAISGIVSDGRKAYRLTFQRN